jgi:hypothetical protein
MKKSVLRIFLQIQRWSTLFKSIKKGFLLCPSSIKQQKCNAYFGPAQQPTNNPVALV